MFTFRLNFPSVLAVFWIFLFLANPALMADTTRKLPRLTVLPVQAGSGIEEREAEYMTEKIRAGLINSGHFEVLSNDQMRQMIQVKKLKQALGKGSQYRQENVIDLANALESEKMVVGYMAGAFGEYTLNVRMLDARSQKYIIAQELSLREKSEFPAAARKIVNIMLTRLNLDTAEEPAGVEKYEKITNSGLVLRTLAVPGWGHIYGNRSRGWLYSVLWAAAGGAFAYFHIDYTNKRGEYLDATSNFDSSYDAANQARKTRGYASYAFLAVYAITWLDLLISRDDITNYQFSSRSGKQPDGFFLDLRSATARFPNAPHRADMVYTLGARHAF